MPAMNAKTLPVALIQEANHGDAEANLAVIESRVAEAAAQGARLVLLQELHNGAYFDTPYNLYHRPANRFVADFVGQGVFLPGTVVDSHSVKVEFGLLESRLPLQRLHGGVDYGKECRVEVLLRPDDVIHDDSSNFLAEVRHRAFRGAEFMYTLRLPSGAELLSLVPSHHNHAIGEHIGIRLDVDHVVAFPTETNSTSSPVQNSTDPQ